MPFRKHLYPREWPDVSRYIRFERAQNQCECTGRSATRVLCGLHCTHPGPRRCVEVNHTPAVWAKGRIILTVAHLCECSPLCADPGHLAAFCPKCHLLTDKHLHAHHAAETRRRQRQQAGQLTFLPEPPLSGDHR